uniref:Capsid protein n=1 Tax=Leishmania RNA virus sp. TaxID=70697 RepID=A0A059T4H8_9VIRU|nr:capsid protein [Leishmania RNA virus 2]
MTSTTPQMNTSVFNSTRGRRVVSGDRSERVYTAALNYRSTVRQAYQATVNVHWRIKQRSKKAARITRAHAGLMASFYYADNFKQEILKYHSRHVSTEIVVGRDYRFDFRSLLHHAGACMAHYCLTGELDINVLSSHKTNSTAVTVLSNADGLSILGADVLYLPNALKMMDINIFNCIYLLAAACESNIIFDDVILTGGGSSYNVPAYNAAQWSRHLHNTIIYLLHLQSNGDGGCDGALALTAGLHSVMTVVAHSDEGGFMRDVLRSLHYGPAKGIVVADPHRTVNHALPVLMYEPTWDAICGMWDYVTVATAGLVHLSDPCELIAHDIYPTIITAPDDNLVRAMESRLEAALPAFASNYIHNLAMFMGVGGDQCGRAADTLIEAGVYVCSLSGTDANRHVLKGTMAPWFWVESTGLFRDLSCFNVPGLTAGYGPQAIYGSVVTLPGMQACEYTGSRGSYDYYNVGWTSLRKHPLLVLANNKVGDGIAHVQVGREANIPWLLPGQPQRRECTATGHGTTSASCQHKRPDRGTLDEFIWGRFSTGIFHPAELTSFTNVEMRIRCWAEDSNGDVLETGAPVRDIVEGGVEISVNAILLTNSTDHIRTVPAVRRNYQAGAKYLEEARSRGTMSTLNRIIGGQLFRELQPISGRRVPPQPQPIRASIPVETTKEVSLSRVGPIRINPSIFQPQQRTFPVELENEPTPVALEAEPPGENV